MKPTEPSTYITLDKIVLLDQENTAAQQQAKDAAARVAQSVLLGVESGIRVVLVRTGVVLSGEGGALEKMLPPFKLGIGGRLGSGRQWFPWIHIEDIVGIFRHGMLDDSLKGPLNGAAPESVTNAEFTRELARALHRPAFLPVPQAALRVVMGELADALFESQRVVPAATLASGYEFHFPQLAPALADVLGK